MMTRKDYESLATALGQNIAAYYSDPDWNISYVFDIISDALQDNYPNFDRDRFRKAVRIAQTQAEDEYSKLYD